MADNGVLKTRKTNRTILHLFDYDGCIGNFGGEKFSAEEQLERIKPFLDEIKAADPENHETFVGVGSARQSYRNDVYCKQYNNTTSCFGLYQAISDYWGATFDTFLMADALGNLSNGRSLSRAINPNYIGKHEGWHFDESKISLLYARIHRAAAANPDGEVIVHFYDDRDDILSVLDDFFISNYDLLPPNVEISLHRYIRAHEVFDVEEDFVLYQTFYPDPDVSLGIDENYKETAKIVGEFITSHSVSKEDGIYPPDLEIIINLPLADEIRKARAPQLNAASELTPAMASLSLLLATEESEEEYEDESEDNVVEIERRHSF
ncbi:MAG: hypothetical protein QNK11_06495 [Legionella sp.]|nr:hypothetical protein [Legionella sp.]